MKTDSGKKWRIAAGGLMVLWWACSGCSARQQVAMPAAVEPSVAQQITAAPSFAMQDEADRAISQQAEAKLTAIANEIAVKVRRQLKAAAQQTATVAVTAAVPLSDFKRETEFGRLLAEYLLTDLADQGINVAELRLGREIIILPQTGEFVMTRNPGELLNNAPAPEYVVVSTFTNTRSTLIIQGRLVGMKTGLVGASWRYTMELNREILGLFFDPREVAPEPATRFTMAIRGLMR